MHDPPLTPRLTKLKSNREERVRLILYVMYAAGAWFLISIPLAIVIGRACSLNDAWSDGREPDVFREPVSAPYRKAATRPDSLVNAAS